MYRYLFRPLFFRLYPETVHKIIVTLLNIFFSIPGIRLLVNKGFSYKHSNLNRSVFGIDFPNPVGLAAGFDKNAEHIQNLEAFGFGFIEIGSVTPKPQPGNPKPRSFRLPADKAIINRMGFNNKGVGYACERLKRYNTKKRIVVGGNIGKNTATPNEMAVSDYLECFSQLYPFVDYFVVNVSCPNVSNLKDLQQADSLRGILEALTTYRTNQALYKPMLLKVSPDLTNSQLDSNIDLAMELGVDGFVATNTTTKRDGLLTSSERVEKIGNGGLSGKPLSDRSTETIKYINTRTDGKLPIIGVGGIFTPEDAIEKLEAGASLIQVYTGFIYSGPSIARKICKTLAK